MLRWLLSWLQPVPARPLTFANWFDERYVKGVDWVSDDGKRVFRLDLMEDPVSPCFRIRAHDPITQRCVFQPLMIKNEVPTELDEILRVDAMVKEMLETLNAQS